MSVDVRIARTCPSTPPPYKGAEEAMETTCTRMGAAARGCTHVTRLKEVVPGVAPVACTFRYGSDEIEPIAVAP